MIISVDKEISKIKDNLWKLLYDDIYIVISKEYAIRVTKDGKDIWFEVDSEPLMSGCYLYATNDLRECLSWCCDNLDIDLNFY